MSLFKNKKIQLLALIVVVIISGYKMLKNNNEFDYLKQNGETTIGIITDHRISGFAETYTVYYKYEVKGKNYDKSIVYSWKFTDCERTRSCIDKKFVVYYDKNNPTNAVIDFDDEK